MEKISLRFGKKIIFVDVKKVSFFGKYLGLMFRTKRTENLLFVFGGNEVNKSKIYSLTNEAPAIHSFFVFFRFLAIWLDEKNSVVDWHVVRPFTPFVSTAKRAKKLIEIPFNGRNIKLIRFIVGKRKV